MAIGKPMCYGRADLLEQSYILEEQVSGSKDQKCWGRKSQHLVSK